MKNPVEVSWLDIFFALMVSPFAIILFFLLFLLAGLSFLVAGIPHFIPVVYVVVIFYPALLLVIALRFFFLRLKQKRWWIWFLGFSGLGFVWFYFHLYFSRPELLEAKIFSSDTLVVTLTFGGVGFLLWLHHRMRERRQQAAKLRDEIKKLEEIEMGVL